MIHENDRGGLKNVNAINKFEQETHEKGEESGTMIQLKKKYHLTKVK